MESGELAPTNEQDTLGSQSSPAAEPVRQPKAGDLKRTNTGPEGRFELKEPAGAETLRYLRPDHVTAEFESEIQGSIVYLHKLSQPKEYYIVRGTPSITQLLSKPGPAQYMANLPDYQNAPGNPYPDLVWIHLPANNMSWVEALATIRYKEAVKITVPSDQPSEIPSGSNVDSARQAKDYEWDPQLERDPAGQLFLLSPGVWTQRQYNGRYDQPSKQERFLQPLYSKISTLWSYTIPTERDISSESHLKPNSVIFMPYIHWEESENYLLRNKCLDWMIRKEGKDDLWSSEADRYKQQIADETATNPWTGTRANKELEQLSGSLDIDSKLLLAYAHEASPLHVRRTLDQSFYYTLPDQDIRERDLDQVLYRYTKGDLKMTSPRILMVDQLWLWIIDEPDQPKTVITAFPQKWGSVPMALETNPRQPSSLPPAPPSQVSSSQNITMPNSPEETPSVVNNLPITTNTPAMRPGQPRCSALYDFTGQGDNKVTFKKDDLLSLFEKGTNGWWLIESGSGKGWAPSAYLKQEAPAPGDISSVTSESVPTLEIDRSQFYGRIFSSLQQANVEKSSIEDLVSLIIDKCSGLFHPRCDEIDHVLDCLEVFAIAIGKVAVSQTTLHNALCTHSRRMKKLQERSRQLSSAALRDKWGGNTNPAIPTTAGLVLKNQAKATSSTEHSSPKTKHIPSISEQWSRFSEPTGLAELSTDEFPDLSEALRKGTIPEIELLIEHEMNDLVDITKETECMKEIKDILDELNIIASIFKQQLKIVKAMINDHRDPNNPQFLFGQQTTSKKGKEIESSEMDDISPGDVKNTESKYKRLYETLKGREQDIDALKIEGTRIYEAICDLLDLKQKQASVFEAYSARQEAKESARQGKTILLFTIVTIIFLPLSFVAGIFSMNAKQINGYTDRSIGGIIAIMLPFTLGTLLFALLLAYNTSIKWFLIGLLTWDRNHQNLIQTAAKLQANNTLHASEASGTGTASTSGAKVNENNNMVVPLGRRLRRSLLPI